MSNRRTLNKSLRSRFDSRDLNLRFSARKRSILDYNQIKQEVISLSKIPLLLKEARRQKSLLHEEGTI